MNMSRDDQRSILNIQYGVFLGVIFTYCFYLHHHGAVTIKLAFDPIGRPECFLLIIYYLLDWLTSSVKSNNNTGEYSHVWLFVRVGWIGFLGATVVALNSESFLKFILLFVYCMVSGLYDAVQFFFLDKFSVILLMLSGARLLFGFIFFIPVFNYLIDRKDVVKMFDDPVGIDWLFWLILAYVIVKVLRYVAIKGEEKIIFNMSGGVNEVDA